MVSEPCSSQSPGSGNPVQLDPAGLAKLRAMLQRRAAAAPLTTEVLHAVATEAQVPAAHVYVALSTAPELNVPLEHGVQIAVCTGGCAMAGSLNLLEQLLADRDARAKAGQPTFDVLPRQCLSLCAHPPALVSRGPQGLLPHGRVGGEQLETLVRYVLS